MCLDNNKPKLETRDSVTFRPSGTGSEVKFYFNDQEELMQKLKEIPRALEEIELIKSGSV